MVRWSHRAGARRPALSRSDSRVLLGFVLLLGVLGFYAYKSWKTRSVVPIVGPAWVADGDTLEIAGVRIRLQEIDAPELDQTCTHDNGHTWSCGRIAARALRAHVGGRELTCQANGTDRYQRLLAVCYLPDGSELNAWMVREGWALISGHAKTYQSEQEQAKAGKRGIWAGTFTPPREWRQH